MNSLQLQSLRLTVPTWYIATGGNMNRAGHSKFFFLTQQSATPQTNFNFLNPQPQVRNCMFKIFSQLPLVRNGASEFLNAQPQVRNFVILTL